jgi:hypothetical protein
MEDGTIPRDRIQPLSYLDFFADPAGQLERLYAGLGLPLSDEGRQSMLEYVEHKPKDKFGKHEYATGDDALVAAEREKFRYFQEYFGVASEL